MTGIAHFAFPMALDPSGHPRVVEQDELDHVRDQIHVALLTRIGQGSPLRPSWGTPDLAFLQQPIDIDAIARLLADLVPGAAVLLEQDPGQLNELIAQGIARVTVNVSTGG